MLRAVGSLLRAGQGSFASVALSPSVTLEVSSACAGSCSAPSILSGPCLDGIRPASPWNSPGHWRISAFPAAQLMEHSQHAHTSSVGPAVGQQHSPCTHIYIKTGGIAHASLSSWRMQATPAGRLLGSFLGVHSRSLNTSASASQAAPTTKPADALSVRLQSRVR